MCVSAGMWRWAEGIRRKRREADGRRGNGGIGGQGNAEREWGRKGEGRMRVWRRVGDGGRPPDPNTNRAIHIDVALVQPKAVYFGGVGISGCVLDLVRWAVDDIMRKRPIARRGWPNVAAMTEYLRR